MPIVMTPWPTIDDEGEEVEERSHAPPLDEYSVSSTARRGRPEMKARDDQDEAIVAARAPYA